MIYEYLFLVNLYIQQFYLFVYFHLITKVSKKLNSNE